MYECHDGYLFSKQCKILHVQLSKKSVDVYHNNLKVVGIENC